jgi:hypothetical protein
MNEEVEKQEYTELQASYNFSLHSNLQPLFLPFRPYLFCCDNCCEFLAVDISITHPHTLLLEENIFLHELCTLSKFPYSQKPS